MLSASWRGPPEGSSPQVSLAGRGHGPLCQEQSAALGSLSALEVPTGMKMVERHLKRGLIRCRWRGNESMGLWRRPRPLPFPPVMCPYWCQRSPTSRTVGPLWGTGVAETLHHLHASIMMSWVVVLVQGRLSQRNPRKTSFVSPYLWPLFHITSLSFQLPCQV